MPADSSSYRTLGLLIGEATNDSIEASNKADLTEIERLHNLITAARITVRTYLTTEMA